MREEITNLSFAALLTFRPLLLGGGDADYAMINLPLNAARAYPERGIWLQIDKIGRAVRAVRRIRRSMGYPVGRGLQDVTASTSCSRATWPRPF